MEVGLFISLTFYIILSLFNSTPTAAQETDPISADALAISKNLTKNSGFNCSAGASGGMPNQPERGIQCKGFIAQYSQPLHIYIPTHFLKNKAFGLAYHFHGYLTAPEFDPFQKEVGDFGYYLTSSGKNLILVVPESTGRNANYNAELNSPEKMQRFFDAVDDQLKSAGLNANPSTPKLISGHSGAGTHLGRLGIWRLDNFSAIPSLENVTGIALLDCGYDSRTNPVVNFAKNMKKSDLFFIRFNPYDGSENKLTTLRGIEKELIDNYTPGGVPTLDFKDTPIAHMSFMRAFLKEFFKKSPL